MDVDVKPDIKQLQKTKNILNKILRTGLSKNKYSMIEQKEFILKIHRREYFVNKVGNSKVRTRV